MKNSARKEGVSSTKRLLAKLVLRMRPMELASVMKSVLRIGRVEAEVNGLRHWVDPISNLGSQLLFNGAYETNFTGQLLRILRAGDIFLDVGANEGYFSLLAADRVGESGHVYIMEPQARLWGIILYNFLLNQKLNYTLVPYAAGEKRGEMELILHPSLNTGSSTLVADNRRTLLPRQFARLLPLDFVADYFRLKRVRLLKIDVEGYELFVLRGALRLLGSGKIDHILLELHPAQLSQLGHSPEEITTLLRESGFRRIGTGNFEHWMRDGVVE